MRELQRYPWPGNVRELRNIIERAVIVATGRQRSPCGAASRTTAGPAGRDDPVRTGGRPSSAVLEYELADSRRRRCGRASRPKPTTLESRMARLGITRKKMD